MFITRHFGKFSISDLNPPYSLNQPRLTSKKNNYQKDFKSNSYRLIKKPIKSLMSFLHILEVKFYNKHCIQS